jgi:hypothetical protein
LLENFFHRKLRLRKVKPAETIRFINPLAYILLLYILYLYILYILKGMR